MPVLIVAIPIIVGSQTALTEKKMAAYGRAGGIAEIVLSFKSNYGSDGT